jgi:heptosyltransferase I
MPSSDAAPAENVASPTQRLLIVRLGAMGDIIHSLPAAAALRRAFPEIMMGWLIEERWAELLCTLPTPRSGPRSPQRPLVERIHTVNTKLWRAAPFSVQTWERIAASLSDLRAAEYEAAVDFQGAVRSSLLARWSGAPVVYGAAEPRENPASMFYTRPVITAGEHIVEQNLSLAEAVAWHALKMSQLSQSQIPEAQLPLDPDAERQCDDWLNERGIVNFALLNPGAGWGAKQWPAERYGDVARQLGAEGVKSLINVGPNEEDIAIRVKTTSGHGAETFMGSLSQLVALTRRARLFIGGDTGPMHLAAALNIPVVGIFGPTNPGRNGPFGTRNIILRSPSSSTSYKHVTPPDSGLLEISSEQVVAAARQLLKERHVKERHG